MSARSRWIPDDPLFPHQWALHNTGQNGGKPGSDIHALDAWSLTRGSPDVVIAVLDTGVDSSHPDLAPNLVAGASFVDGATTPLDDHGHGTQVAGILAATSGNRRGITGVCPGGRLMPVKVANAAGHTDDRRVAEGIRWAVDHGARVINLSLWTEDIPSMRSAIEFAYNSGVVVVAAAGNGGVHASTYPASYSHVLAVGGSDHHDRRVSNLPYCSTNLVLAPSTDILTTGIGPDTYQMFCCSSAATPHVAGLAALILSRNQGLTVDQVVSAILHGTDPVEGQNEPNCIDGWGRINCFRSLEIAGAGCNAESSDLSPASDAAGARSSSVRLQFVARGR